jgi:hypothetical protein
MSSTFAKLMKLFDIIRAPPSKKSNDGVAGGSTYIYKLRTQGNDKSN